MSEREKRPLIRANSTRPSAGIRHVLFNGTFIVQDSQLITSVLAGRPVRAVPR